MSNEPDIIRQSAPHEISVTEGSQVAASRNSDPNAPQVRRVLAGEDRAESDAADPSAALPPPLAPGDASQPSGVFERHTDRSHASLQAPQAAAAQAASGPVFERAVADAHSGVDAPLPESTAPEGGPVLTRAIADRFEPVAPEALTAPQPEAATAPSASHDRRVHADQLPPRPPPPAPVLARELPPDVQASAAKAPPMPDNWQKLPPAEARPLEAVEVPPAQDPVAAPSLPPVPTAQAQAELLETARQAQAQIEETLGPADPQWVEMDFPARVIRLKIENDKVRTRLDQLEALSHPPMR